MLLVEQPEVCVSGTIWQTTPWNIPCCNLLLDLGSDNRATHKENHVFSLLLSSERICWALLSRSSLSIRPPSRHKGSSHSRKLSSALDSCRGFGGTISGKDDEGKPWIPNQKSLMCSRHFEPSCFKLLSNGVRRLLPGSIPTIFPEDHPKAKIFRRKTDILCKKAAAGKEDEVQVIQNQDAIIPSKKSKTEISEPYDLTTYAEAILKSEDECNVKKEPTDPAHCLEDLCRLCSEPCVNDCENVFAPRMPIRLGIMINFCLPIQVNRDDILPLNICIPCKAKVEEHYKFALQCKSSEKCMMEMHKTQKLLQLPSLEEPVTAIESNSHPSQSTLSPSSVTPSTTTPVTELSQTHTEFLTVYLKTEMQDIMESSPKDLEVSIYNCKYCHGTFYERQKCESHMRTSHRAQRKEERCKKIMLDGEESIRIKEGDIKLSRKIHKKTEVKVKKVRVPRVGTVKPSKYKKPRASSAKEGEIKPTRKIPKKPEVKVKKVRVPRVCKVRPPKPKKPRTPSQCHECSKMFCSKDSLRMHIKRHNSERNFICHICGLRFLYNCELNHHNKHIHDGSPVWCDICNTKFSRRQVLSEHMIAFHLERYRYICKECNDFHRTKREIKEHMKRHGENADFIKYFLHRCVACNIDCKTRYQKRLHFQEKHKDVRLNLKPITYGHYCKLCFKLFSSGVTFQNHYKKQHPNISVPIEPQSRKHLKSSLLPYLYNCELCSRKFKFSDKFSSHMKKHNSEIAGNDNGMENA
ncbi:hypothetical protein B566_EDAN007650 [Ephemera danica]|nr:hypothetical protein B566_EDAN007650 [Ephemera danica]